ncbi:MAG: stage 0 sporulation family protein [Clostridia bacterium]|nr:stage 0 sporulation family protein [Clostridia bacterium]
MAKVVVVKFKGNCKPYYFGAGKLQPAKGQGVVVETSRGMEFATVVDPVREVEDKEIVSPLKPIARIATEKDLETVRRNEERRGEAMKICKEKIRNRGLEMKLIDCEFTFDGGKVIFTFTAEGRVDFRDLVKDLASVFHMRIELRQVGIRDETRILGGIAPCGRECCCAGCMPEFKKVSIKMAKNQGLSLNPGKISGLCGRLMCCLSYENDYYAGVCKQMPKLGSAVGTAEGKGTVISVNMLKQEARVKIEKDGAFFYRDFPVSDLVFKHAEGEQKEKNSQE